MEKINSHDALEHAIKKLEEQQANDRRLLSEQFHLSYESIKPINIIKSTFDQVANSQALKGNVMNTGVGLAVGYLSKVLFQPATGGPIKNMIGSALQFGITNVVAKNLDTVKSLGTAFFRVIRRKSNNTPPTQEKETT
jgi:hypothetical protein